MRLPRHSRGVLLLAALLLTACTPPPADETPAPPPPTPSPPADAPALGLMTSLPLYWPVDAALADIAAGTAAPPWQRRVLERRYRLVPLDTLSPIPALSPDQPDTDPLAGLSKLAVIQPRGLSPADNVALDGWVRAGGKLLLVLDPLLTGDYDQPLGDPRRPVDSALVPPVVARWGMAISLPAEPVEGAAATLPGGAAVPLADPGTIAVLPAFAKACQQPAGAIAICRVGKGRVTLIADAALFEHPELAGVEGAAISAVLAAALD